MQYFSSAQPPHLSVEEEITVFSRQFLEEQFEASVLLGLCANGVEDLNDRCHDMIKSHDFGAYSLLVNNAVIVHNFRKVQVGLAQCNKS